MIEAHELTKRYPLGDDGVEALRGVSFTIGRGEMVAIMGPSGSGKSTLMNIVGCLDVPTNGSYRLEGVETGQLSDDRLSALRNHRIGFVFQQFNLLPRMSALEQVELPLLYAAGAAPNGSGGGRRALALEALALVGLSDRVRHRPTELSGGQQQRVAIARALVTAPSLILADEPTGALDSRTSAEVMALLGRLNRERGITVILVTHEAEVAAHAGRVIHLRDGRIGSDERRLAAA
jgi:putative ABC transport system ATP-binding protein